MEALQCPADPGRWGSLGAEERLGFPAGLGLAGLVRFCGWRQGRAGTRFSGKRLNDSHGQVGNNLLEGDASSCAALARR